MIARGAGIAARWARTCGLAAVLLAHGPLPLVAQGPIQLTPPSLQQPKTDQKPESKSPARSQARPAPQPAPNATPEPAKPEPKREPKASEPRKAPATPAAASPLLPTPSSKDAATASLASPGREPDLAYGAFQRGFYLTAFAHATRLIEERGDREAMTLLGELYAQGLGVVRNEAKAVEWYRLAADRGDRNAMFVLGMTRLRADGDQEGVRLLSAAAKLGHPAAAYNLGLLYLEGQRLPQDLARAAELFRPAAAAGYPEAQYALATLYKEGRGVPQDDKAAADLLGAAALADHGDAMVEFAIALFNGAGTQKNEAAAAALFLKAARKGSPIAQNRLARILSIGRGMPANPVEAVKWHLIAKANGAGDSYLDDFVRQQPPQVQDTAQKAAQPWLDEIARTRS